MCRRKRPYFASVRSSITSSRLALRTPLRRRFQSAMATCAADSMPRHTNVTARSSEGRLSSSRCTSATSSGESGWSKGVIFTSALPSVPSKNASVRVRCTPMCSHASATASLC